MLLTRCVMGWIVLSVLPAQAGEYQPLRHFVGPTATSADARETLLLGTRYKHGPV